MAVAIRAEARAAERAFGLDLELRRVVVEREEVRARALEAGEAAIFQERVRSKEEIGRERQRAEHAEAELAKVLGSRSWRATAPLRGFRARWTQCP